MGGCNTVINRVGSVNARLPLTVCGHQANVRLRCESVKEKLLHFLDSFVNVKTRDFLWYGCEQINKRS